jgi:hypothetical protein
MTRSMVASLLAALALAPAAPLALGVAGGDGYRLAGIMKVGADHIGFLELPQGGQVLVREGTTVNGGRIVEFSDRVLRIAFPDRVVELVVDGSGAGPAPREPDAIVIEQHRAGEVAVVRQVAVEALTEALSGEATTNAAASIQAVRGGDPGNEIARRFAPLLDLPANSRVLAVNEQPVRSAEAAIAEVERTLAEGGIARLNLGGVPGMQRVYLMPHDRGNPATGAP